MKEVEECVKKIEKTYIFVPIEAGSVIIFHMFGCFLKKSNQLLCPITLFGVGPDVQSKTTTLF